MALIKSCYSVFMCLLLARIAAVDASNSWTTVVAPNPNSTVAQGPTTLVMTSPSVSAPIRKTSAVPGPTYSTTQVNASSSVFPLSNGTSTVSVPVPASTSVPAAVNSTAINPSSTQIMPSSTAAPTKSTPTPTPRPPPSKGGAHFDVGSFFGGIILGTVLLIGGFLAWRYYQNRRSYHHL